MAGKKVLVVDDEKLIVKGIRFSLEQDNMEVDCAYDGEEALQMAHNKEYDIIFTSHFLICQDGHRLSEIHGAYHSRTFGTQGGDVSLVMVDEVNLTSVLRNIRAQNGSQRTGAIDGTSHIP